MSTAWSSHSKTVLAEAWLDGDVSYDADCHRPSSYGFTNNSGIRVTTDTPCAVFVQRDLDQINKAHWRNSLQPILGRSSVMIISSRRRRPKP